MAEKNENQRTRLTKRLLKDTLLQLLQEKSMDHISVREICTSAGINRSTFYNHYGSPYDLLREIEQEFIDALSAQFPEEKESEETIGAEEMLYILMKTWNSNPLFTKALLNSNISAYYPLNFAEQPLFRRALRAFLPQDMEGPDEKYLSSFLLGGAYNMLRVWINEPDRENPEEFAAFINRYIPPQSQNITEK